MKQFSATTKNKLTAKGLKFLTIIAYIISRYTSPGFLLMVCIFLFPFASNSQINFTSGGLSGAVVTNPTSIQFSPDNRLYVSQQNGIIKAFTIERISANNYSVTATETIGLINQIPNHNDNGSPATSITTRQITGILVAGTSSNPVIYVTSSDSRIGGPNGDLDLDTNSGMISMLTWNGSAWIKVDLVRGLPRSEENHSPNGMQLDAVTNTLYLSVGGLTNAGSPSLNFAYLCEFALSAAILSVDLDAILAMPTQGSGNNAYKYDLPTLDDPTRTNSGDKDVNDPFGGNDGLNQAKITSNGPVQIFSPGYRNAYDLLITKTPGREGRIYTIDNGANQGWGGYPENEGPEGLATNNYVSGEPGSNGPGENDPQVNNLDNLHYIGNISTYEPGSYYGGHPTPIRANPSSAGLYTHINGVGVWRTSKTGPNPLPADWPPVLVANPIEGDFQMPGSASSSSLLTFTHSTNGLAEYTASNFNNALKGVILAASFDGNIYKITPTADGTNVTNAKNPTNKLNQEIPFASGFGSIPLDITAQGDNDLFPGTVWVATYGAHAITIFEPQDMANCSGADNHQDDDADNYTNADEIDNNTNPCSAASKPKDFDGDKVSDLNDPDDDNDGINDVVDKFQIDPFNGINTIIPLEYNLFNNDPGTGFFGVGFNGLMTNGTTNYFNLFDENNLIVGGAVGAFTIINISLGDALGPNNTQQNAFQFGVKPGNAPFTVNARMLGSFFNGQAPVNFQSQGIYIGTGDQSNYLKITLNANGGTGGIEVVYENADVPLSNQYSISGGIPSSSLDLYLSIDPVAGTVQPKIASNSGSVINIGSSIQLGGALLNTLQNNQTLAVGIISTSKGAGTFSATWDFIKIYPNQDPPQVNGSWQISTPNTGSVILREENAYVKAGNKFYLMGGRGIAPVQEYDPINKSWTNKSNPPQELHHFQAVTHNGLIYVAGAFTGGYPNETPVPQIHIYNPLSDKWHVGSIIPLNRRRGSAGVVVYNKKIYMICGIVNGHNSNVVKWFDEYDPVTNSWKTLPDAPRVRDHFHATVHNNKLYLVGGRRTSASTGEVFNLTVPEVDIYDFTTGMWSTLPSADNLPIPRAGSTTAKLSNEIIIVGGESSQPTAHIETHALNIQTNKWRRLADLQQGRHGTQVIESNNGLYIVAGAGNQGGSNLLTSQESFYFSNPTTPNDFLLTQSQLVTSSTINFGNVPVNDEVNKILALSNYNGLQDILVTSIDLSGGLFSIITPIELPFVIPVGQSIDITVTFKPIASVNYEEIITINHSGQNTSNTISLTGQGNGGASVVYRINAGGPQVTNSIGTFAADNFFSPVPGSIYSRNIAIAGTLDDLMYQTERFGTNQQFSYAFPVSNGNYTVVLHFAEIFWNAAGNRKFDITIEGALVKDNFDIFAKVGQFTATTESFLVAVNDGTLNIDFSALSAVGGIDNPKVSAIEILSTTTINQPPVVNAGNDQTVILPTNTATLTGTASDDGSIASYAWTKLSGPAEGTITLPNTASTNLTGLVQGTYVFRLTATDNGSPALSAFDDVSITVNPSGTSNVVYRINAGGPQVTNSIGTFAADNYFAPVPGSIYSRNIAIAGTLDDLMYQTERFGTNQQFSYAFPVSNGNYTVVLHFAELFWNAAVKRKFDITIEGALVKDNFDIFAKVGQFTATTESFGVAVNDGTLNIDFSALSAVGGIDNPKVSAIEILSTTTINQPPVVNAGNDQTITLPTNSVSLSGSATDDGSVASYAWTKFSGPAEGTITSPSSASTTVTGLVQGTYVFRLTATDNGSPALSSFDDVSITVNASGTSNVVYRINAGGPQVTNSIGTFAADNYFSPVPGSIYSRNIAIAGTNDDLMYQTERFGTNQQFSYAFPVSNGNYTVVFHFAELFWNAAGKRKFDITIEGALVKDNFDIFAKIGQFTVTTESFLVTVNDGTLNIDFNALSAVGGIDNPKVSAIEILSTTTSNQPPVVIAGNDQTITLPTNSVTLSGSATDDGYINSYVWTKFSGPAEGTISSPSSASTIVTGLVQGTYIFRLTATDNGNTALSNFDDVSITVNASGTSNVVYRINAGGPQVTNSIGTFAADNFFSPAPGNVFTVGNAINGTNDDAMYQTERYGTNAVMNYAFPVSNGNYTVILHFSENWWSAVNKRKFDITIESNLVKDNFEIYAKVGKYTATTETFNVVVNDGILNIDLSALSSVGGLDNPKVSAIEVKTTSIISTINKNHQELTETEVKNNVIDFKVFPNPSTDGKFTISIYGEIKGDVNYKLMSASGNLLTHGKLNIYKPNDNITLDFSEQMHSAGVYNLQLIGNKGFTVIKLIHF